MDKHQNCFDRCQLNEHKGYRACGETSGECEELRAEIRRLMPKAESGEQWARICALEGSDRRSRGEILVGEPRTPQGRKLNGPA